MSASNCKVQPISSSPFSRQCFSKSHDLKSVSSAVRTDHRLLLQVYHQLVSVGVVYLLAERRDNIRRQRYRKDTVLIAVVTEDVCKRGREDRFEPILLKCPRGMLTRAAATEIRAGNENACTCVAREVQHEFWVRFTVLKVTPVVKKKFAEACPFKSVSKIASG